MQTLNQDEEDELLHGVKQAIALVDDQGHSPDDAIAKVARDHGFGPGKIRLVAYAYNTGRQTAQRQAGGNILAKLATFPLADPDRVIAAIYGSEKTAETTHADYQAPPDWLDTPRLDPRVQAAHDAALDAWTRIYGQDSVKAAGDGTAVEPIDRLRRLYGTIDTAKRAADEASFRHAAAMDGLNAKVAALVSYFRDHYPHDRIGFAVAEKAAAAYLGPVAVNLLGLVHRQGQLESRFREKRASADLILDRPVDLDAAPFPLLAAAVKLARDVVRLAREKTAADQKAAQVREEQLRSFGRAGAVAAPAPPVPAFDLLVSCKAAGLFSTPAIGAAMGTMISRSVGAVPETKDDLVNDAVLRLEDPQHQNELRRIQAHAMLNGFMTDPDDPISGYDPDEVLSAYNDLAKLAPRSAAQPAVVGPLLRKRLSGQFEPFESKEVSEIEKTLAQSRPGHLQGGSNAGSKPSG